MSVLPTAWDANTEEGPTLLAHERACSSVRSLAMATFLYDGLTKLNERLKVFELVENDPVFRTDDVLHLDQMGRYDRASEKAVTFVKKCRVLGLSYEDAMVVGLAIDEIMPIDVHMKMFVPTLIYQTSPEQRAKLLPLAQRFEILGAYAQTELGHGSNVRALETTATYDAKTQTFIMHSPTLTSMKWWPGGLGKTANYAVVLARLLVGGKDYGIHSFIMQLRSLVDHQPLPGVQVGDIGKKLGFNSVDNGYLILDHVRIPRNGMLMGLVEVTAEGVYREKKGADMRMLYGAMLDVRAGLVQRAALTLGRVLTIAVRYSVVRRQGFAPDDSRELQVIDYPTQQHALMPLLAWAYALQATGQYMRGVYTTYLETRDASLLGSVHALSSGLKAFTAELVSSGIDTCRRCCGGHGYLLASGFPEVFSNYTAVQTFEGTQQVLEPQLARYLLKLATGNTSKASIPKDVSNDINYILEAKKRLAIRCNAREARDFLDPTLQIEAFECRCAALIAKAGKDIQVWMTQKNAGRKKGEAGASLLAEAMSTYGVLLGHLSRAHCQLIILKRFHEAVAGQEERLKKVDSVEAKKEILVGQAEVRVLRNLVNLYALSVMEKDMGGFRMRDYMTAAQADLVPRIGQNLCRTIRLEAVSLVDAFMFSDKHLNSAMGRFDGRVYSTLYQMALESPLNAEEVTEAYRKHWVTLTTTNGGGSKL